ncbi:AraC family transcriptional regulator [Nocardia sp. NBC_00403]|uniref:AraC family transcriptional regulator n=1 Tax=Nocardia sp. NBC_00403 TaxID=2975990 RepID=UPI002E204B22
MGSLIRATNLWGYGDLVRELGADPGPFLSRFHIQPGIEYQEDAFVSFEATVRLLEASAADLDCPDFGLRLARWQGLDILGPIAVIARNAQTLLGGLESIARYLYVHSPALKLAVARTTDADLQFIYKMTEPTPLQMSQGYELSMANAVRMIRLLGGPEARPRSVSFVHGRLGSDAAYREALGCTVLFGQPSCGFVLPRDLAARRIDSADPETRRIATKYMEAHYVPSTTALSERVAELARRLLPTGQCSAEVIADQLTMHPRTLQRRLAVEGVSCQDLIERVRRNQAARYLAEPRLQLSQIAGLLGYAEQSTLNRSCRRWFGKTPRQYRADLLLAQRVP